MASSNSRAPDPQQKAKWALSSLWKKLHFGHIAAGKREDSWKGMEAAYRFGLDPFRKHLLGQLSARFERKKLMTFRTERPQIAPIRAEMIPHGTIISILTDGAMRQVIRNWPEDLDVENHTIYDEKNEEYIKIVSTKTLDNDNGTFDVEIDVQRDLVGNHNLMIKGRPVTVHAESNYETPKAVIIKGVSVQILQTNSVSNGKITNLVIPIHRSEIDADSEKKIGAVAIKAWKPRTGTEIIDNGRVLVENWSGNREITLKSIPKSSKLTTSEGIPVVWKVQETDGFWVKLTSDIEGDAVYDPVDALFESGDIRELVDDRKATFQIYERNRGLRILRLDKDPKGRNLQLPTYVGDLLNQKTAIERLQGAPLVHHIPLMDLATSLEHEYIKPWPRFDRRRGPITSWKTRVASGAEGSKEQQNFILKALSSPDFSLLEGPPGSGKTETIGELILQLLSDSEESPKILLCGNTQASIDNVLSRFARNDLVQPLRLVNSKRWRNNPDDRDALVYDSDIHEWTEPEQVDDLREKLGKAANDLTDAELSDIVFRRSNLVCATMGTVVQHPHIKKVLTDSENHAPPKALFDVLIIDEASKTTFTEFLVPAIFCKKWVLVGDVAQLPPFTNQEDISGMLDLLESKDEFNAEALRKACLNIKNTYDDYTLSRVPRLLVEKAPVVSAMQQEWTARMERNDKSYFDHLLSKTTIGFIAPSVEDINHKTVKSFNTQNLSETDWQTIGRIRLAMMECQIVVISESLAAKFGNLLLSSRHLPRDMMDKETTKSISKHLPERLKYRLSLEKLRLQHRFEGEERGRDPFSNPRGLGPESTTWGKQVAWRIQRVYEMQTSENIELRTKYLNETKSLLPCSSNAEEWAIEVEKIRCFSLPSILESLQYGFMSQEGRGAAPEQLAPRRLTTLSSGFPAEAKSTRFESIRHQHRMHWSISKFPRTEFYQASDGDERLQDANSTLKSRVNFTFLTDKSNLRQQERRYWIDVKDGHQDRKGNAAEVREAMNILSSFLDWFDSSEASEFNNSSLVLLTPYVNQSRLLREAANRILKKWNSGLRGTRANVLFKNGRKVVIFCSTVDKFQGQEADVVVFSLRNVHRQGNMDSPNRANVGLTRAREAMFVVGKKANYTKAFDPMLKRLATDMSLGTSNNYWRKKA